MKRALSLAILAGLCGGTAWAQAIQNLVLRNSFNPVGAGARGLGMGGAFIAVADDGTAASFNPAGLAQLRRTELAFVGFSNEVKTALTIPKPEGTETASSRNRHGAPEFAGLAIPFEVGDHNLTIQASYQRSVDLFGKGNVSLLEVFNLSDLDPNLEGTGEIIADVSPEQSGAFHTVSLSAGYQATSRLSLGMSLNYWLAGWTSRGGDNFRLRIETPGQQRPIEAPLSRTTFNQDQSLRGFNLSAGFLLHYPRVSVGGVVRFPFAGDYTLDERDVVTEFGVDGRPLPSTGLQFGARSRLHWPQSAGVGIALRPFKRLTLAGDYTRTKWSRTFIEDVPGGALLTPRAFDTAGNPVETFTDRNFFDLLPAPQTFTRDSNQFRAGAEYLIVFKKVVVPLRGGVFRDRSPVIELGTGEGRKLSGFTVGTGLNFTHVVVDVAFERQTSEGQLTLILHARGGPNEPGANFPTVSDTQNRLVASLIFRLGDNDPLKRVLRRIFVGGEEQDEK